MKKPQRVFSDPKKYSPASGLWNSMIRQHEARVLKNGENPQDFPADAVAFETSNFGWIYSKPNEAGQRRLLAKY